MCTVWRCGHTNTHTSKKEREQFFNWERKITLLRRIDRDSSAGPELLRRVEIDANPSSENCPLLRKYLTELCLVRIPAQNQKFLGTATKLLYIIQNYPWGLFVTQAPFHWLVRSFHCSIFSNKLCTIFGSDPATCMLPRIIISRKIPLPKYFLNLLFDTG